MKAVNVQSLKRWAGENAPVARAVLLATAHAQVMREKVNAIHRVILADVPMTDQDGARILDPRLAWTCSDNAKSAEFYAECDRRERADGVKPDDMPVEYCPALVAEEMQRKAERLIIESSAEFFGVSAEGIHGNLDVRAKWLQNVLGACVRSMNDRTDQIDRATE